MWASPQIITARRDMPYPVAATRSKNFGTIELLSISGIVYDSDGTTVVSGATVAIGAASATSAANGTYSISGLSAGTNGSLTCTKAGYSWTAITVVAMSGNLISQNYVNAWWAAAGSAGNAYAIYKAIGAASLVVARQNILSPGTHDLTNGATAPTHSAANGFIHGEGAYLVTDFQPAGSWTRIVRFSDAVITSESFLCGVFDGTASRNQGIGLNATLVRYDSNNSVTKTPQLTSGVLGLAGANGWRNGTKDVTTLSIAGASSRVEWIGVLNLNGTAYGAKAKNIQAIAYYNATLTDAQITAISTAMAALTNP